MMFPKPIILALKGKSKKQTSRAEINRHTSSGVVQLEATLEEHLIIDQEDSAVQDLKKPSVQGTR